MASLKIKSSNAGNVPTNLGHRELGIHNNQLYFGSSTNTPIRLLNEGDLSSFSIPSVSESSGLYENSKTIYAMDGTWANRSFSSNNYYSLSMDISSNRNLATTSNFNTIYLYPTGANSEYPITIVIACRIGSSSYDYNIVPVNSSGSTTATNQMKSSSWDDIELKVGGWLVYTCKPIVRRGYTTQYLWSREVYYYA